MPSDGGTGNGATLSGSVSFTAGAEMAEIRRIGFPDIAVDDIDVTSMGISTTPTQFRSFVAGLIDPGRIEIDLLYAPANHSTILAAVALAPETWTITLPAVGTSPTSSYATKGYIGGVSGDIPQGSEIVHTVTIKCSGVPTKA